MFNPAQTTINIWYATEVARQVAVAGKKKKPDEKKEEPGEDQSGAKA